MLIRLAILGLSGPGWARYVVAFESSAGPLKIEKLADGFDRPWAIAFLPPTEGGALITERGGKLFYLSPGGRRSRISGTPQVVARGQGGLLDVVVPRDFATSRIMPD